MRLKGNDEAKMHAKALRRSPSLPETLLWQQLRDSGLGVRFRRQHPAGPYVLDFFCAPASLAIEIDGGSHDFGDRPLQDGRRDEWLAKLGILVLRIPAVEILENLDGVLAHIRQALVDSPSTAFSGPPPPIASREE